MYIYLSNTETLRRPKETQNSTSISHLVIYMFILTQCINNILAEFKVNHF